MCSNCKHSYTSNWKLDPEKNPKYLKRLTQKARFQESDTKLRTLYTRIKKLYFSNTYIPNAEKVFFTWKRGQSGGGWCNKKTKEIRIGGVYKYAFIKQTQETQSWNDSKRKDLVNLMIHEAIHLRLAHHKKSFRLREKEFKGKVKDTDIINLYEGLIKE